jgi:hypothetical protein
MGKLADWVWYKAGPASGRQLKRLPRPLQVVVVLTALLIFMALMGLVGAIITIGRFSGGGPR